MHPHLIAYIAAAASRVTGPVTPTMGIFIVLGLVVMSVAVVRAIVRAIGRGTSGD